MITRRLALTWASLLTITWMIGCETAPTYPPFDDPSTFFYDYKGYGDDGDVVVQGILALQYDSLLSFTGVWKFDQVGGAADMLGPQIGHGTLKGQVTRGELRMSLNPQMTDRHVELVGSVLGRNIDGSWRWMGVTGPLSQGKFIATPRSTPPPQ